MADATYLPKVYMKQGGDEQVVASGGTINVETGGAIKANGTQAAAITNAPAGGTGATAGAYDTAPHRDELIAAVNSILAALRGAGIIVT